jgi:TRAP transporter TAXI family solute receptor
MLRLLIALLAVVTIACGGPAPQASQPAIVRVGASSAGGNFYPDAKALADAAAHMLPSLRLDVQTVGGAVRSVDMLRERKIDLAFSFSNVAYAAYSGEGGGSIAPFPELRGIAVLDVAVLHMLVGPQSRLRSVADLRGARVDAGGPGSGSGQAFKAVLEAFGLRPQDTQSLAAGYDKGVAQLVSGDLDAMFVLGNYPSEPVSRALARRVRLVPIDGPETDRLRAAYQFFVPALIPPASYPGQPDAIHTIGVESLLLCHADLDEAMVHDVTAAIFGASGGATTLAQTRNWTDVKQAAATPVPLHPGAARYYRERELSH